MVGSTEPSVLPVLGRFYTGRNLLLVTLQEQNRELDECSSDLLPLDLPRPFRSRRTGNQLPTQRKYNKMVQTKAKAADQYVWRVRV